MATIAKISNGASAASALNYALGQDRPMHEKTEQWLQDHQLERPVELTNCRAVAVGGTNGIDPFIAKEQFDVIRQLHNQTKESNQVLRITQSFALDELNPKVQKDGTVTVKGSDGKMKVLPKTGETENIALSVLGSLMVLGSAFIFKKRI